MEISEMLVLACEYLGTDGNTQKARLCLATAIQWHGKGETDEAKGWALRSLAHSVGITHPDYIRASE